jgi:hypothetical protein
LIQSQIQVHPQNWLKVERLMKGALELREYLELSARLAPFTDLGLTLGYPSEKPVN